MLIAPEGIEGADSAGAIRRQGLQQPIQTARKDMTFNISVCLSKDSIITLFFLMIMISASFETYCKPLGLIDILIQHLHSFCY